MIEAMKQALEALESYHSYMEPLTTVFGGPRVPAEQSTTGKVERAITALRQAIAEAEKQDVVTWVDLLKEASQIVRDKVVWKRFIDGTPLATDIAVWMADFAIQYTHPQPKRKPLTDEQIEVEWERITGHSIIDSYRTKGRTMFLSPSEVFEFARAIEAAHGIKE